MHPMMSDFRLRKRLIGHVVHEAVKRARAAHAERSSVYKRARIEDIDPMDQPSKRQRLSRRTRKMPRRRYSRRRPRRGYRKRYARMPRRIATLMPNRTVVRGRACTLRTNNTHGTGAMQMIPVQLNSILDPFVDAGTNQLLGFDQWRALYNNAYVIGAKLKVEFHNADSIPFMVGITPMAVAGGTTSLAYYDYYKEVKGTKSVLLTSDVDKGTLVSSINLKRWVGIKNLIDTNEYRMDLNTPSEPSKACYWHVWTQAVDKATEDGAGVHMVLTVEYVVLLLNPVIPARSVA